MDKITKREMFQKYLEEDIKAIPNLKVDLVSRKRFYLPLAGLFLKYFFLFCVINLSVICTLSYSGGIYLADIHHMVRDIIIPNLAFSGAALLVLSQLYIFKSMTKGQLKSLDFIKETVSYFEMIFFAIYVVLYAIWLQSEGTIAGTIMGASIGSFVISAIVTSIFVNFEAQRLCLPVISKLISEFNLRKNIQISNLENK